jgi:hypothetical protein
MGSLIKCLTLDRHDDARNAARDDVARGAIVKA